MLLAAALDGRAGAGPQRTNKYDLLKGRCVSFSILRQEYEAYVQRQLAKSLLCPFSESTFSFPPK